jgi:hypothetical protein
MTFTINVAGLHVYTGGTTMVSFTDSEGRWSRPAAPRCSSTPTVVGTAAEPSWACPRRTAGRWRFRATSAGDGEFGVADFLALLVAWGFCSDCGDCAADFDGDSQVCISDFLILLGSWG